MFLTLLRLSTCQDEQFLTFTKALNTSDLFLLLFVTNFGIATRPQVA